MEKMGVTSAVAAALSMGAQSVRLWRVSLLIRSS